MGDQLRVNPEQFRGFAPRFTQLKEQTDTCRTSLASGLASEGECWGADEAGASFASKYVTPSHETIEAISDLAKFFDILSGKVGRAADSYQQTDTGSADAISSHNPGLGG